MPNDQYGEVPTIIIVAVTVFFLLIGIMVFFTLYYQRKRMQYAREKQDMEKDYAEQILQSRLEMQEQTFETISQEIHDNVGQLLSLAKVQLSTAEQNPAANKTLIAEIKTNIGNALTDLRDIAKSLSAGRLQQLSLEQAIEQELQRMGRHGLLKTQLNIQGEEQPLAEQKKIIVFRMAQECFQNTLKHAKATEIRVDMMFGENALQIKISDDGAGFNTAEKLAHESGLGLRHIVTRTRLIGGEAVIASQPQHGTQITLNIPYE